MVVLTKLNYLLPDLKLPELPELEEPDEREPLFELPELLGVE
jgi:hypothetical protein